MVKTLRFSTDKVAGELAPRGDRSSITKIIAKNLQFSECLHQILSSIVKFSLIFFIKLCQMTSKPGFWLGFSGTKTQ